MVSPVLCLQGFGVAFHERVILRDIHLAVPAQGVTLLMGPAAGGKSTLLRAVAGLLTVRPEARQWGNAWYAGEPLGESDAPAIVVQKARLMTASILDNLIYHQADRAHLTRAEQREIGRKLVTTAGLSELVERLDEPVAELPIGWQRRLAIVRCIAAQPRLLCIDEPTAELPPGDAAAILKLLADFSRHRAVLMVTHNQAHAQRLGGEVALLVGGQIVEQTPTQMFFSQPQTACGKQFVRTGGCGLLPSTIATSSSTIPAPSTPAHTQVSAPPLESTTRKNPGPGPRGFVWLWRGKLGGMPRPGLLRDPELDLDLLRGLGVTHLVCLTAESPPLEPALLARFGLQSLWFPLADMAAPTLATAWQMCDQLQSLLQAGACLAVHCRAGLGRTGTVLAAQLIYAEQRSAPEALEIARRLESRWVQSAAQLEFLAHFATAVEQRGAADRQPQPAGLGATPGAQASQSLQIGIHP